MSKTTSKTGQQLSIPVEKTQSTTPVQLQVNKQLYNDFKKNLKALSPRFVLTGAVEEFMTTFNSNPNQETLVKLLFRK